MATIKDVALRANVSVTTVSHVVNATRFVSEDSRQRVNEAIAALKYVPSALARSLKNNRTYTIGMMIPNCSNPFFAELIRGIEDTCFAANFNVILCNSDDDANKQRKYIRVLMEKQVDGLIVFSSGGDTELSELLLETGMPQILLDREVDQVKADLVEVDHEAGAWIATKHLIELGHPRIGCITGPLDLAPARQRLNGYRRALDEAGIQINPKWEIEGGFTSEKGYVAMQRLLVLNERPSAIFASNDLMAIGALCAATRHGLRVPEDISVVGFDDIALAAYSSPPLTTVAQPKHQLGSMAASFLMDRIVTPARPLRREILQSQLCVRQSTMAYPGDKE
jgi:LacI family transcriptional regulator